MIEAENTSGAACLSGLFVVTYCENVNTVCLIIYAFMIACFRKMATGNYTVVLMLTFLIALGYMICSIGSTRAASVSGVSSTRTGTALDRITSPWS